MLPVILFFIVRKWGRNNPRKAAVIKHRLLIGGRILALVLAALIVTRSIQAQESRLSYSIIRNGKTVGSIQVLRKDTQNRVHYKLESQVKTRFIMSFTATAMEETVFENGLLVFSSIYRKLNGTEKVNRKTVLDKNRYLVTNYSEVESKSSFPIDFNTLCLYYKEPLNALSVYSDNFQCFLPISDNGKHVYTIILPDGSSNIYHYKNGICQEIDVNHTLYSATVVLNNSLNNNSF
jgi:hypothetical protein